MPRVKEFDDACMKVGWSAATADSQWVVWFLQDVLGTLLSGILEILLAGLVYGRD